MGGLAGMIKSTVQTFATAEADIHKLVNKANAAGSSLTSSYPVTPDATVKCFVTTPTLTELEKLSDDARAEFKIIFPDATVDVERTDHVVTGGKTYTVVSVREPSTPTPFLTIFADIIQPGRGDE